MEEVDLKDKVVGEIELPTIDIEQYIGKDTKIAQITEFKGQFGYSIRLESEVVDILELKNIEGKPIELRASKLFGLQETDEGRGWGKETKLGLYLAKYKVKHYRELIGQKRKIQSQTGKDGKDYLSFN